MATYGRFATMTSNARCEEERRKITVQECDAIDEQVRLDVCARHRERLNACIDRPQLRTRKRMRERTGDGSAARADVENIRRASSPIRDHCRDEFFGFRARHKDVLVDCDPQSAELFEADQVCDRLARHSSRRKIRQFLCPAALEFVVAVRHDGRSVEPGDVTGQQPRLKPRRIAKFPPAAGGTPQPHLQSSSLCPQPLNSRGPSPYATASPSASRRRSSSASKASTTISRSPAKMPLRLPVDNPMRWSVNRSWGKLYVRIFSLLSPVPT